MKSPKLISQPSEGPRQYVERETGARREWSTPCAICRGPIAEGERITYFDGGWDHEKCVSDHLVTKGAAAAWLTLGSQLARFPSAFRAADTRVIVGQLLRMAAGMQPDAFGSGDDEDLS